MKAAKWFSERWQEFFFAPKEILPLGVFRFFFGILTFQVIAATGWNRRVLFGREGVLTLETAELMTQSWTKVLLSIVGDSAAALDLWFIVSLTAALFLAIGFLTRFSAVLVFLCASYVMVRNPSVLYGPDAVIVNFSFLIAMSPAGNAFSVDRWRRDRSIGSDETHTAWAFRLIQIHVAWIYLSAVYFKLTGAGWVDGSAVHYILHLRSFRGLPVPGIDTSTWISFALTWGTLALEFGIGTLIWWRKTRLFAIALAIMLHLGLELFMRVPYFQWFMVTLIFVFTNRADWEKIYSFRPRFFRRSHR